MISMSQCDDPEIVALSSLLFSVITGKRTSFQAKLLTTLHGLTRCREIIDLMKKFSLGICMTCGLNLRSTGTPSAHPEELAEGLPGTGILDNDDFQDDTLTGANTSHHTNVMFVQPEDIQTEVSIENRPALKLVLDLNMKTLSTE